MVWEHGQRHRERWWDSLWMIRGWISGDQRRGSNPTVVWSRLVGGLVAINFAFSHINWVSNHPLIDEVILFRGVALAHQAVSPSPKDWWLSSWKWWMYHQNCMGNPIENDGFHQGWEKPGNNQWDDPWEDPDYLLVNYPRSSCWWVSYNPSFWSGLTPLIPLKSPGL